MEGGPPSLRDLPAVEELANRAALLVRRVSRELVVDEARRVVAAARAALRAGTAVDLAELPQQVAAALAAAGRPSLRRVINATGVVLHTNLGRAPLPDSPPLQGYCNLEYDLAEGRRGQRDAHAGPLLERLLGAPAIMLNNNAAAIFLALHELADGHEVIVSRGELVEIGDGFRIPDIMARAGVTLREVGTTNRTRIADYRDALTERTRLLLRVHPSNFRIEGFTAKPSLAELVALGRERGVPLYEDLGSGCMVDLRPYGIDEPLVGNSLAAGVDLVSFSTDKLFGGPQAGVLAGRADLVARLRRNPLYRMLRLDKLILQSLETTTRHLLRQEWDEVPTLRMVREPEERLRERATAFVQHLVGVQAEVVPGRSVIGGGSTPAQSLPTWLVALTVPDVVSTERALRAGEPAVVARIENGRIVIDLRTVTPEEEGKLANAVLATIAMTPP